MSSEAIKIIMCDLQWHMLIGSGCVGMTYECLPNLRALKTSFLNTTNQTNLGKVGMKDIFYSLIKLERHRFS